MPTVENTGKIDKFVGTVRIKPNEIVATEEYPNPTDTNLKLISDLPIWQLDQTGKPVKDAIATTKDVAVPYGTNTIEIYNKSSGIINVFNAVEDADNFEMLVPPSSIRYIEHARNRVKKLVVQGTAAINEVFISFSKK